MKFCYPIDLLWRDPLGGAFSLVAGRAAAEMVFMLDTSAPDGLAVLRDAEGRERARGPYATEAAMRLRAEDGAELQLERIELGALSLYAASARLLRGRTYAPVRAASQPVLNLRQLGLTGLAAVGAGAMVATLEGELPAEWLRPGDRVLTRDNGYRPLVGVALLADPGAAPDGAPFWLPADAFGPHQPQRPVLIAPTQRVLVAAPELQLWFGDSEMFARGAELAAAFGIAPEPADRAARLFAMFCLAQEVILVDGLWLETALPAPALLAAFDPAARADLALALAHAYATPARATLAEWELALIARAAAGESRRVAA